MTSEHRRSFRASENWSTPLRFIYKNKVIFHSHHQLKHGYKIRRLLLHRLITHGQINKTYKNKTSSWMISERRSDLAPRPSQRQRDETSAATTESIKSTNKWTSQQIVVRPGETPGFPWRHRHAAVKHRLLPFDVCVCVCVLLFLTNKRGTCGPNVTIRFCCSTLAPWALYQQTR